MAGKIAIVGAGPSGCFVAQALLKKRADLDVDILDAMPVPFGLIRYGVAADHQGTKAISRQFARVFEKQGARFFGNVTVGHDLSVDDLLEAYDAVVLAVGLSGDRKLGVPGESLTGIYGSASFTRSLYEHPDASALPALGRSPVIVGNGNVALDILRIIIKSPDDLAGSDLGEVPTEWHGSSAAQTITIVGRGPALRAKFDTVMIQELSKLRNVTFDVRDIEPDAAGGDEQKLLDTLLKLRDVRGDERQVVFRFECTPVAVEGSDRVTGLRVQGKQGEEVIEATSIITAIGFDCDGNLDRSNLLSGQDAYLNTGLAPRLYAAGWFRYGARGSIPDSRVDAQKVADQILNDLQVDAGRIGSTVMKGLDSIVDYAGWKKVDAYELETKSVNRVRQKLTSRSDMVQIALGRE